jgi:hypothetical protein
MMVPKVSYNNVSEKIDLIARPVFQVETYIVKRNRGKEILVLIVTSPSPEVSNLLGLDVRGGEGRAFQCRSWGLEDRQGREQGAEGHGDARDGGDDTAGEGDVEGTLLLMLYQRRLANSKRAAGNSGQQAGQSGARSEEVVHDWLVNLTNGRENPPERL